MVAGEDGDLDAELVRDHLTDRHRRSRRDGFSLDARHRALLGEERHDAVDLRSGRARRLTGDVHHLRLDRLLHGGDRGDRSDSRSGLDAPIATAHAVSAQCDRCCGGDQVVKDEELHQRQ